MKPALTVPALILLLTLGAFSGTTSAGQASKPVTACTLFTAAEIRRITATKPSPVDTMKTEEHPTPGGGSECDVAGFGIQLDAVPVARFEANRQAYSKRAEYERVPDVGDEAYFYDEGAGSSVRTLGIYGRTATHVFVISNIVMMNETPEELRPQLIALGKAAAAKLR